VSGDSRILFLSNGHGEDTIASSIITAMLLEAESHNTSVDVKAFPLVGKGTAYQKAGVELVGPVKELPTGGFARQSLRNLATDMRAGLGKLTLSQFSLVRSLKQSVDLAVCVGDIFPLALAGIFLKAPAVFVATAKSDYYTDGKRHHWGVEVWAMKKWTKLVYTRDEMTAESLRDSAVNAHYVGNAMMDCLDKSDEPLAVEPNSLVIGVLPGSREEAYENLCQILKAGPELRRLSGSNIQFVVAAASNLDIHQAGRLLHREGWVAQAVPANRQAGLQSVYYYKGKHDISVHIYKKRFGDVIESARIVIGLAGTGNEQAVGLGKPVVSFPGKGHQFTRRFAFEQTKLLGESVSLVESDPLGVAAEVIRILDNPDVYKRMAEIGKERMGGPGASHRIAQGILSTLVETLHTKGR
jgi:uncharacterized protein (TIGR03492 family)